MHFLKTYLAALDTIPGWCTADDALFLLAYGQVAAGRGISGDVLEIGAYQGRSAIVVAALRGVGGRFTAIDLFDELQGQNLSVSGVIGPGGGGIRAAFLANLRRFYPDLAFVDVITAASTDLQPEDVTGHFSFCHVDGGHSAEEAWHDLRLCTEILLPGGLLALDDYGNPQFPGVQEGADAFGRERPGALLPIARGFNKVLFQKPLPGCDLNADFAAAFPSIPASRQVFWERNIAFFCYGFAPFIDIENSAPGQLVARFGQPLKAHCEPAVLSLEAPAATTIEVPVRVTNASTIPFEHSLGLSYHLEMPDSGFHVWDNPRVWFAEPLLPGDQRTVALPITLPSTPGRLRAEIDIVYEGVAWLKNFGNPTKTVEVRVLPPR